MTRITLDKEIKRLGENLTEMGGLCIEGMNLLVDILKKEGDEEQKITRIHQIEKETDRKESDTEDLCMKIILRQQPVAKDLKAVKAGLHMISDMERVGDQIADISEIATKIDEKLLGDGTHILTMLDEVKIMINDSIKSYVDEDVRLAELVIDRDENVDELFTKLQCELVKYLYNSLAEGESVLDMLMIAKYLERIGDHAVNIAEYVIDAYR